jgi:NRPS condensation-like uncharacterized protein
MIPGHYVQLPAIPLTSNGKVDRRSLPSPEGMGMESGRTYVAARNETERVLVGIWQEILGKDQIGVYDDFFELGGHSLKATRLSSQVHRCFGVKVALRELFSHSVLWDQAVLISGSLQTSYEVIPIAEVQESYPLSSSQRRLWVLSQFEEGNVAYNMPGVYEFNGTLDVALLESCLRTLVFRHEILRTVFRENSAGEVRQYILDTGASEFGIPVTDLRGLSEQPGLLSEILSRESMEAFDLSMGPLLRTHLYRRGDEHWVFTYTMHHIISDGWSMDVLINELLRLYNSGLSGESLDLPALRIQYKDYASWQQEQLKGEALSRSRSYWLSRFSGELPVLELSGDRARPQIKTYNGGMVYRLLDKEVMSGLESFVQSRGATLFMGLLSAVNVLLYRYTGQQDIIIGSPIAGREHADLNDQIGFYVNTLALRTRIDGSMRFTDLLEKIKGDTLEAYEHQSYPFDELVDELELRRDMSRNALFDVLVVLQNTEQERAGDGRRLGEIEVVGGQGPEYLTSKFDLTFDFTPVADQYYLTIEYSSDLYDRPTAERMLDHLGHILGSVALHPETAVGDISYLDPKEEETVLRGFNDTFVPYPDDQTVIDLFEAAVAEYPERTALVSGDVRLSYKALNALSNQLARRLRMDCESLQPGDLI